jgi:AraC-like DNA-binding protein
MTEMANLWAPGTEGGSLRRNPEVLGLPFGWAGRTATIAAARGAPILNWLADANVGGPEGIIDDRTALSVTEYAFMCIGIMNLVDDEIHAVSRTRIRRGTATMGLRVMGSARNLRTAIEALNQFYTMIGQGEKLTLVTSGPTTQLQVSADISDPDLSATVQEMIAISLHCQFSFILDRWLPLRAFSTHGDHPYSNQLHPYLGCPVVRGNRTALVFPTSCLNLEPTAKLGNAPATDSVLYWLKLLAERSDVGSGHHNLKPVSAAVYGKLQAGDLSYAECSLELRLPSDDLRRALAAEGTGYRRLRRSALIRRLRPHLVSGANLEDVAPELGYSDARSLRRSVRSASGLSIAELRKSVSIVDTHDDPVMLRHLKHQLDVFN